MNNPHNWAEGIDVSHWKPVLDWNALADSGVSFVGIKATEGLTTVDPMFEQHRTKFQQIVTDRKASGQPYPKLAIYYHFARSGDPVKQAELFLSTLKACGELQPNERISLDLEVPSLGMEGVDWLTSFFQVVDQQLSEVRPILYTSNRIWRQLVQGSFSLAYEIDLWCPRYNDQMVPPQIPDPWSHVGWTFWQWTDGSWPEVVTPGVGKCDRNFFNGSPQDLDKYLTWTFNHSGQEESGST